MRQLGWVVVLLFLCSGCGSPPTTFPVPADDVAMNSAMARARAEAQTFVERLRRPRAGDRDFSAKVAITEGDQVEHFWLQNVRYEHPALVGTLANDPELVRKYKFGEQVKVPADQISDWMYVHNDRLVGNYTLRVFRDRMTPAERKELDQSAGFRIE